MSVIDQRSEPAESLEAALAAMRWSEVPGRYAIIGIDGPPDLLDLATLTAPAQLVIEDDETTLLVREEVLTRVLEHHPNARTEVDLVWFRFETAMDWEVVGFLAMITSELAEAGVSLGTVCGFSRDHVFVHARHREVTREVLGRLFPEAARAPAR